MQIENSQPESKRIMPETKFTEFPALSVNMRVGIYRSASETADQFFFHKNINYNVSFLIFLTFYVA